MPWLVYDKTKNYKKNIFISVIFISVMLDSMTSNVKSLACHSSKAALANKHENVNFSQKHKLRIRQPVPAELVILTSDKVGHSCHELSEAITHHHDELKCLQSTRTEKHGYTVLLQIDGCLSVSASQCGVQLLIDFGYVDGLKRKHHQS